jgi:hypothetical protein
MSDDGPTDNFIEVVDEILCVLHNLENADEALQALSAVTTLVLCNGMSSAEEADEAYNKFINVIGSAMEKAESSDFANWTRGTSH